MMRKMSSVTAWLILVVVSVVIVGVAPQDRVAAAGKQYRIAIVAYVDNPFWDLIHKGAMAGAEQVEKNGDVKVDWITASPQPDVIAMNNAIASVVSQHYDGLLLTPIDPAQSVAIDQATKAGVAVMIMALQAVQAGSWVSFIGSDYYKGGQIGADLVAEALLKRGVQKGKIGIITTLGLYSERLRVMGFRDEWARIQRTKPQLAHIEVLPDVDGKDNPAVILPQTQNLLTAYPDLVAMYVAGGSQYVVGNAVLQAHREKQVSVVSNEGIRPNLESMAKGGFYALIDTRPYVIAKTAVEVMYNYLKTRKAPPRFDYIAPEIIRQPDAGAALKNLAKMGL